MSQPVSRHQLRSDQLDHSKDLKHCVQSPVESLSKRQPNPLLLRSLARCLVLEHLAPEETWRDHLFNLIITGGQKRQSTIHPYDHAQALDLPPLVPQVRSRTAIKVDMIQHDHQMTP